MTFFKKICLTFVSLVLLLSIFMPLVSAQSDDVTYTPGTYTGSAEGRNGLIEVEVSFTDDRIVSIEVVSHNETDGLSDASFEDIPQQVIESQSLAVEVVSGASATSNAVIEAISDAVNQAGADPAVLASREIVVEESDEVEELATQVVVVGGGASGLASALRSDELGLDVILLEKMSFLGGAISISGGNQVVMGSDLQAEAGVTDDSVESMVRDFLDNGNAMNNVELLTLYAENIGQTTDWLNESVGIEYDMEGGLHTLAEYSYNRELAYVDGGPGFAKTARSAIDESNVEVYLQTRANEIITDDNGRVTGLIAQDESGKTYNITADAVILATGGYGNNDDLLTDELQAILYYGPQSATGDGITMATADGVDAATRLMEYGKTYPNGIEVSEGIAKSTIGGNLKVLPQNGLLVSTEGQRVVNERSSNADILEVQLEQDPQILYLLMDANAFQLFRDGIAEGGISEQEVDGWLENNGSQTPYFYHAESLTELAELAGMPSESLTDTVERYNGFVENGSDTDFNRQAEYLEMPVGEGPYYLVEQKPRFATTMGGLVANTDLSILNADGDIIEGLFAAGETVGGVMGTDSPSGANNGWALTSGKLVAESAQEWINSLTE